MGCDEERLAAIDKKLQELAEEQRKQTEMLEKMAFHQTAPAPKSLSPEDFASAIGRKPFTVREYCRFGQIQAKKIIGRSRSGEWRIPYEEIARFKEMGPSPVGTFQNGPGGTTKNGRAKVAFCTVRYVAPKLIRRRAS